MLDFLRQLHIYGLDEKESIILGALITEQPLLFIGAHGTAKSHLVSRIAKALEMEFRHYNAALINYDDIIGIPVPDEAGTHLNYLQTPNTLWNAQFIFFDEVNRCRADTANKMFSIVHEGTVNGIPLTELAHCWGAMNQNYGNDDNELHYMGVQELDPAFRDRWMAIIQMPDFYGMGEDQMNLLRDGRPQVLEYPIDPGVKHLLRSLIDNGRERIIIIWDEHQDVVLQYVQHLVNRLKDKVYISGRRAAKLVDAIIALATANELLEERETTTVNDLEGAASLTLLHCLPQYATPDHPDENVLMTAHSFAWEQAVFKGNPLVKEILTEQNPLTKIQLAAALNDVELKTKIVTNTINGLNSEAMKIAISLAIYYGMRDEALSVPGWEVILRLIRPIIQPRQKSVKILNSNTKQWNTILNFLEDRYNAKNDDRYWYIHNYLVHKPDLWNNQHDWHEDVKQLEQWMDQASA